MKKKAAYLTLIVCVLIGLVVYKTVVFVLLRQEECRQNYVTLFSNLTKENYENLTTSKYKKMYSLEDHLKSDDSTWPSTRVDFIGKAFWENYVFICPSQGDNLYKFGCNGIGYKFIYDQGKCKLDSIDRYFD